MRDRQTPANESHGLGFVPRRWAKAVIDRRGVKLDPGPTEERAMAYREIEHGHRIRPPGNGKENRAGHRKGGIEEASTEKRPFLGIGQ